MWHSHVKVGFIALQEILDVMVGIIGLNALFQPVWGYNYSVETWIIFSPSVYLPLLRTYVIPHSLFCADAGN